jgi:hypothetical protein
MIILKACRLQWLHKSEKGTYSKILEDTSVLNSRVRYSNTILATCSTQSIFPTWKPLVYKRIILHNFKVQTSIACESNIISKAIVKMHSLNMLFPGLLRWQVSLSVFHITAFKQSYANMRDKRTSHGLIDDNGDNDTTIDLVPTITINPIQAVGCGQTLRTCSRAAVAASVRLWRYINTSRLKHIRELQFY